MTTNKFYIFVILIFASLSAHAEPFIIAVAGGSASGKTHIARLLVESLGADRAALYSMDNYFAPEKQSPEHYLNGSINYDHPTAVDLKRLAEDLKRLKAGQSVRIKEYTYGREVELEKFVTTEPSEFIILEGLYVLHPELNDLTDLKVFVDVDVDTRLQRRLKRDTEEGRSDLGGMEQYFKTVVEPMHQAHIQSTASVANLHVSSPDHPFLLEEQVQRIQNSIEQFSHFKRCEGQLAAVTRFP